MPAKTTLTALALTAAASAALAGPAGAATKTSISIQAQSSGVFGFVKSSKSSCHSGRKVTVYRKVAGPDKKAGSDTAQPNQDGSQYSVSLSRKGRYYAKVKGIRGKCKGATSKTTSFSPSEDASTSHALSEERAMKGARAVAKRNVRSSPDYVAAKVTKCKSLFPHRVRCYVSYYTSMENLARNKAGCKERLMMLYSAHDGFRRDYTVRYDEETHSCNN